MLKLSCTSQRPYLRTYFVHKISMHMVGILHMKVAGPMAHAGEAVTERLSDGIVRNIYAL